MPNRILFGREARDEMMKGIDLTYKAVSATLGAAGKNCVYRSYFSQNPMVTNDGVSIAMMINPKDEAERMGCDLIKQSARRTNDVAGDGTTTNIVLVKAMIDKGLEKVEQGENPMILRKQMEKAVEKVVSKIKERSKQIKTDAELFNIANLSMENAEVAKIVAESVKKVGENGTVIVEESNGLTLEKEDVEGIKFDKGYISPYMATDPATMNATLRDVKILVTDKIFNLNSDFFPLLEEISKQKIKQLFVICDNIQGELLSSLIANRLKGTFHCVVVQKPNDPEVLEDIAIVTGADNITNEKCSGALMPLHFNFLGSAEKIIVTKDSTLIIGGRGQKDKIENRIKAIKTLIKDTESQYKKEQLKERLAKLVGGVVVLKVGAPTEAEMRYMKLKVDDAVAATRAAMEEGIVMGGGKTLYEIASVEAETVGEEVVYFACQQLIRKIIENAGFSPDSIIGGLSDGEVWDALATKVCKNPLEAGIIDPAKVERVALENAVSVAGIFLTTETLIIDIPESKDKESMV